MSSPSRNVARGSCKSTQALITIGSVGFPVAKVKLYTEAGVEGFWQKDSMPQDSAMKRLANGTGSYVTSNGINSVAGGFTIGTDAALNPAATTIHWEASE